MKVKLEVRERKDFDSGGDGGTIGLSRRPASQADCRGTRSRVEERPALQD
ncbi:MAG TPA: hypothetical protein VJR69_01170 [Nitrospira sp.]|nr:hypothetical protein [Nitrospira sp.]